MSTLGAGSPDPEPTAPRDPEHPTGPPSPDGPELPAPEAPPHGAVDRLHAQLTALDRELPELVEDVEDAASEA